MFIVTNKILMVAALLTTVGGVDTLGPHMQSVCIERRLDVEVMVAQDGTKYWRPVWICTHHEDRCVVGPDYQGKATCDDLMA